MAGRDSQLIKERRFDIITHQMKIESDWDLSSAFVRTGKVIRAGREETAWARRFNASCLANVGAPR